MAACRGKTALVTNASRKEGRAAALALANAGAQVLVHDDRATQRIESIVQHIRATGGIAKALTTDTSAQSGPENLAQQTREIVGDRLDILVLNPSLPTLDRKRDISDIAEFDAKLSVRARAPFLLVQRLLPILSSGSSVIFTSPREDGIAVDPVPSYLSMASTITGLSDHYCALLKPIGVRVNVIELDDSKPDASTEARRSSSTPSGSTRSKQDSDHRVGELVTFLASNESRHVTGETIRASL